MTLCGESLIRFELLGGKLKLRLAAHCCAGTLHLPTVAYPRVCPVLQNKSAETAHAWACSGEHVSSMVCIAAQGARSRTRHLSSPIGRNRRVQCVAK